MSAAAKSLGEYGVVLLLISAFFGGLERVANKELRAQFRHALAVAGPSQFGAWGLALKSSMDQTFDLRSRVVGPWRVWTPGILRCFLISYSFHIFLLTIWALRLPSGVAICRLLDIPPLSVGLCFQRHDGYYGGFPLLLLALWPILLSFPMDYLSLTITRMSISSLAKSRNMWAIIKKLVLNLLSVCGLVLIFTLSGALFSYFSGLAAHFPQPYHASTFYENLSLARELLLSGLFAWRPKTPPELSIGVVYVLSPFIATLWLWTMTFASGATMLISLILRWAMNGVKLDDRHVIKVMGGVVAFAYSAVVGVLHLIHYVE